MPDVSEGLLLSAGTDEGELRIAALQAASALHNKRGGCAHEVLESAQEFYAWVSQRTPVRLTMSAGPATPQTGATEGDHVQIHDDEQFTLTLAETDSKGQPVTTDTITWSVADESVATLQVSDDTYSATVVAGNPGSTVVTVTDGTLTATEAVDVVAGAAALITLSEGAAEPQAPVTPPATAGDGQAAPGATA